MKEQNELKVVLNIFQKFLELNKCKKVIIDVDGYDLNVLDERFMCNGQRVSPPIPIGKFIESFMESIDASADLDRDSEDGEQEIYNYEFVIDSENKQVSILGNYSKYQVEETQITELYANEMDDEDASGSDYSAEFMAISFAVNDDLSISIGDQTTEKDGSDVDQEVSGISVGYSMGGMTISAHANEGDNVGHTANSTSEHTEVSITFAF